MPVPVRSIVIHSGDSVDVHGVHKPANMKPPTLLLAQMMPNVKEASPINLLGRFELAVKSNSWA